jgi:predicted kinase
MAITCTLGRDNIIKLLDAVYKKMLTTPEGETFNVDQYINYLYNGFEKTQGRDVALQYIQQVPYVIGSVEAQLGGDLKLNMPIEELREITRAFRNADTGLSAIEKYLGLAPLTAEELAAKANFKSNNPTGTDAAPKDPDAEIEDTALKSRTILSGTGQEFLTLDPSKKTKTTVERLDRDKSRIYNTISRIHRATFQFDTTLGNPVYQGQELTLVPIAMNKIPSNQLTDESADLYARMNSIIAQGTSDESVSKPSEVFFLVISDKQGNPLYFDNDGNITTKDKGKYVYQTLREVRKQSDGKYMVTNMYGKESKIITPKEEARLRAAEMGYPTPVDYKKGTGKTIEQFAQEIEAEQQREAKQLYELRQKLIKGEQFTLPVTGASQGVSNTFIKNLSLNELEVFYATETNGKTLTQLIAGNIQTLDTASYGFDRGETIIKLGTGIDMILKLDRADIQLDLATKIAEVLTSDSLTPTQKFDFYTQFYAKEIVDIPNKTRRHQVYFDKDTGVLTFEYFKFTAQEEKVQDIKVNPSKTLNLESVSEGTYKKIIEVLFEKGKTSLRSGEPYPAKFDYNQKLLDRGTYTDYENGEFVEKNYIDFLRQQTADIFMSKEGVPLFNAYIKFGLPDGISAEFTNIEKDAVDTRSEVRKFKDKMVEEVLFAEPKSITAEVVEVRETQYKDDLPTYTLDVKIDGQEGIHKFYLSSKAKVGDKIYLEVKDVVDNGFLFKDVVKGFTEIEGRIYDMGSLAERDFDANEPIREPIPVQTVTAARTAEEENVEDLERFGKTTTEEEAKSEDVNLTNPQDTAQPEDSSSISKLLDDFEFNRSAKLPNGVTAEQVKKAIEWWNNSPLSKYIKLFPAANIVNSDVYGKFVAAGARLITDMNLDLDGKMGAILINPTTGGTMVDAYHEAWHVFSQLFLTKEQKQALYDEVRKLKPEYANLTAREVEEMLAEDFRSYALNPKVIKNRPKRNTLFRKILNFLKKLFRIKPTTADLMRGEELATEGVAGELFQNLYFASKNPALLNNYTPLISNVVLDELNRGIEQVKNSTEDALNDMDSATVVESLDSLLGEVIDGAFKEKGALDASVSIITNENNKSKFFEFARRRFLDDIEKIKNELNLKPTIPFNSFKTIQNLEDNAIAIIRSSKGEHKYIFLRGQVEDFDNLNLDTKAGERIKGELYKGKIEIIGDYFSHKTIKAPNKNAADIIIVNSIEEAKAQFDAYKVDERSSFTDIEQYPERTVNAFEVDYDQAFLLDNLRILRQATDNWEKVIKYYTDKSAYNVMTRKVRIQETDPENDTTDEEALIDPTKSQKFDKGADVNLLEIADKEVVYILKSLFAATRNERGALVYEKNRLGYKKLANYKKVWNAIVRSTSGTKDPRLMYQRIVQAASTYPELQQLIESRLPNPQLVGHANTTGNVMRSFGITTSFWSVFSLPRVPYMQLTVFRNQYETFDWKGKPRISRSETEGVEVTNASTDIGNTIRKFEAHFAARLDSKFTKRDQDNVTVLNLDQVIQDFSDRSGNFKNGAEFQFLNAIGFNLDDLKKIKDELSDPNNLKRFGIEFIFRTIKDLNDANKAGSMSDAARRVYNNFIKNPISGLKKGIEPGVIGLRDSFLLKEGSKQSTQVDRIITLQNRYGSTASTFSVQNPERNRVNEHVSDSTLTVIADGINNPGIGVIDINQEAKQTDMYRFGTTTEHLDPAVNPFADSSIALKSMFMPDKTKRQGRSISVEMNAGTQTINTIISENGSLREGAVTGSNTTSLDKRGKFIQDIHTFLKTGRIELMRPGSKGSSFGWRLDGGIVTSAITKKDQHLYADIDSFLPNTAGEADVIEGIILPYLSSEVKRINIYNTTPEAKNYVGYNREFVDGKTFGQSFVYFDGILSKNLQNEILEKVKDPGVKLLDYLKTDPDLAKRIKAEIKAYFTTKTNELYNYLSKAKFVDKSLMDRLKLDNLNTEQKERILMRAFMYNYWIHNVETSILFLGDLAQYDHKKQELHKRISGLISNGPRIRTDIDAQTFSKILGETSYAASESITPIIYKGYAHTAIMKEVKRDSIYADTIRRGLTRDYERRYRTRNIPNKEALIKERVEKEVEKYTKAEIKEADGQGYITFDAYRLFKKLQNKWSDAQENLYQRIVAKEDISATEIIEMFPVYKLQNFGFVQGTVLPVTAMHKFALMPLIPSMIKGTDFELLHRQMMEQGVHYATFESGSKVGHVTSNGKEADDVFEDADQTTIKPNIKFTVNSIHAGFLKEAASVNSKFKGEVVFSTQLRKLILSGLYEQGKLINDAYAPIVNKYEDTVDFYTELLKYELLNEIEYNTDGKNLVGKPDKFLKLIRENLERKDYPEHLLRQLQTNVDGTLKGDLSYFIDRKTIEKTILSIVEKRFVRQYVNGEPLVQVASTFSNGLVTGGPRFQKPTAAERKKFLGTNNFPFYDVETVDLAAQFKGLSKEELKAELRGRKAVSYPTPAKAYILKNEIEYLEDVIAGKKPSQTTYDKPTSAMKIGIALQGDFVNLLNLKHIDGKPIETRARLNEMIKNEEWLDTDDNRQKITLTAVRIPVQGYNSMEFMEVYEFLDPAASNLIMLPTEIVAKSGGDFDVDKLTTFFPNIDKNGNLYKAPVDNKDFIAEANKIKDKEARKKFIQQQKLATQNQFISSIRSILELPESYASLVRPNDTYILKDLADRLKDDVSDYDKFTKHNGEVNMSGDKKVLSPTTTLEPLFNYSKHEENLVGKAVLGIGASENALSPLFDAAGGKMPLTYKATKYVNGRYVVDTDNPADYKMRLDLRHNKIGDQISLSDIYSADGVDKISDVYSQAMNGWVDIEKDEWIFYIQGNYEIAPTFLYLIKAGVPVKDAVYFVSQPMIREFAEQQRLIGGDYGAILGVAPSASEFTRFQSARDIVNKYTAKYLYAIMGNPLILPTDKFNVEFRPVDNYTEDPRKMMQDVTKAQLSREIAAGNINPLEIMRIYKVTDRQIDLYLAPDLRNTQYYNAAVFASSKADRVDGNFSVDTMEKIIDSKKSVNDLSPREIITEMAMFLHFYEIQKQLMGLSAMKRAGKSDTKTYGNFQEIYLAEVDVDALAENTKIDQEFKRRFLDESVVASLKDKSIITDVAAPMLDLVNNNITNRAIKNIIANRDISSFGVGTDGVIKFIDAYKDAIVTFLYQNYLSNSIDAKGNIISVPQEYRSEKVTNNKALESDVIYTQNGFTINLENIKRDYKDKVYLANSSANTAYKNRDGLKPFNVSEDPFDNEEQYIRYVLERAFQKSKGLTGLQLNQVALMNVYNPNALSKNSEYSYTKMVLDLIDEFPALKTEYPVLEQLSARATKDFYLLTLNDRDAIDGSTKSQYAANIRALGNPRIQKVKGDANNRISAIFSLLPKIAVYQHGHGTTPFGLEQVVPQETVLSATTDAGNLFKLNYWNADVLDLIFIKLISRDNNRKLFKNFLVNTPTQITSPSSVTVTPESTVDPEETTTAAKVPSYTQSTLIGKADVILPIGTSGSGKSTFINSLPQENLVVISPDEMRVEFTGDMNDKSKDKEIYTEAAKRAIQAVKDGKQVVFDTTNLTKDKRRPFIEALRKEIPNVNIQYKIMELNPELAKERIRAQLAKGENRANVSDETIDRHAASYPQMLIDIQAEGMTEYIDPNQFSTEPTEIAENPFVLNTIEDVYNSKPEYAAIGTLEQYKNYINSIFPNSTVKDIVYHGTYENFEEFQKEKRGSTTGLGTLIDKKRGLELNIDSANAFFFTNNKITATSYSLLGRQNYLEAIRNSIERIKRKSPRAQEAVNFLKTIPYFNNLIENAKKAGKSNDEILDILWGERNKVYKALKSGNAQGYTNNIQSILSSTESINKFLSEIERFRANDLTIENIHGNFTKYNWGNSNHIYNIFIQDGRYLFVDLNKKTVKTADRFYADEVDAERIKNFFESALAEDRREDEKRKANMKAAGFTENVVSAIVNLQNPFVHDYEGSAFPDKYKETNTPTEYVAARQVANAVENGHDGVIYENIKDPMLSTSYGVFEPEQIYILGGNKDLEGFKKFMSGDLDAKSNLPYLPMTEEHIDQIFKGTKVITNRSKRFEDGKYIIPQKKMVDVKYLGEAKVNPKTNIVTITNEKTGLVTTRTLDQFAKAEGFKDAADFKKRSILSQSLISGKTTRFIYQVTPIGNTTEVGVRDDARIVSGSISPETNPEINEFNTYLEENNNVFPKEFNASNGRRYLLNNNNLYDLVSPDGKTMYLRNIDLRTGKVEGVPEVTIPVTEERKKQSIRDIKEMIKLMSLDLLMAEDGYNIFQMMEDINNATTMNQVEKIEEIIRKYTC